ncbi:hypothetical protein [Kribbella sp. NPDC004875]|uniref:hypothetical protein n=1 Tax=Kribbella sp. NPDC004875 TaxID=3364107 RepID=UPI00367DCBFA
MTDKTSEDVLRSPVVELPGGPRRWVENSLKRLTEHFGTDPLRRPAVVPSEFVPAGYDASEAAARELCRRVCERMGLPSEQVHFVFRLERVSEAADLVASVLLGRYLDPGDSFSRGASPGDLAAVRTHSDRLGTASFEQVDRLIASGLVDDSGLDMRALTRRLGASEFGDEVVRCLLIASGRDPEQRDGRAQPPRTPGVDRQLFAGGRWIDLAAESPVAEPIPGRSAVLLRSDLVADPIRLMTVASHELGHALLSGVQLPWATGPLEEPLTDLCALFHGFGLALVNSAVDESTLDDEWVHTAGYLGENALADALALYRFQQHQLVRDGPLVPDWYQAIDPVPQARFLSRLDDLIGGTPSLLGW